MANEKYLNYAGLQYYHEKLNLDLASMLMTDDDLDTILFNELGIVPPLPETWTESANGTLNLALGDAFSYWPEGEGTKTISITNGTTAGVSKFFLKLTDAGNFPMQWGSNIQWKDGSEPEWQAFHEDIILFKSNDGGSTWTGQVLQTNALPTYEITITTDSDSKSYDGTAITNDQYSIDGNLADGDSISVTVTGQQTEVGTSDNTFTYSITNNSGSIYIVNCVYGTLEITRSGGGLGI